MTIGVITLVAAIGAFVSGIAQSVIVYLVQRRMTRTDDATVRSGDVARRVDHIEDVVARHEAALAKLEAGQESIERLAGELRVLIVGASTGMESVQRTLVDLRDDNRRVRDAVHKLREDLPGLVAGLAPPVARG